MNRRPSALAVAAVLGITGVGASFVATAARASVSSTDTTSPDDTSPASSGADTTESDEGSGSETTEDAGPTEGADTTDAPEPTEAADTTEPAPTTEVSETTDVFPEWDPEPIEWSAGAEEGTEVGYLEVPIDYANPDDGTLRLYVARHLASDPDERIGIMFTNVGGPGFGTSDLALFAEFNFGEELVDKFDIIGFDPRGTGLSEPAIDCVDDYDHFYAGTDITPDDDAEREEIIDLAEDFAAECVENNSEIIQHIGTNNSARDIDAVRRALGEEEASYFGFSYGSELGATWATLFPDTVRAAVLDGASDPNADSVEGSLQQIEGFEGTLTTFLAQCSADRECAFHNDGDAEGAFDQLMLKLDAKPIPTVQDRPHMTRGMALQGVVEAMYSDQSWPELAQALADAQQGSGAGLLALYDSYNQYNGVDWGNELEAFQVIRCMDERERLTVEEEDATVPQFQEVAPRMAPYTTGSYFCTFFPESTDPRAEITGAGAGPIVVCGATGDAATPLATTRRMAAALEDGRLIVIEADHHTCYHADPCADELMEDYLINLEAPPEETRCAGVD